MENYGQAGRGSGRGAIIRQLLEIAEVSGSSGEAAPKPAAPYVAVNAPPKDSGIYTQSPQTGRGLGRAHEILGAISCSSKSQPDIHILGAGRAKLVQQLRQQQQHYEQAAISTLGSLEGHEKPIETISKPEEVLIQENVSAVANLAIEEVEADPILKRGDKGTPVNLVTNYIRLNTDPDKGVFEYEVRFDPQVHSSDLRHRLLNQHKEVIGNTKTFDGQTLYLPIKLPDHITLLTSTNSNDDTSVQVQIIFKKKKRLCDCIHLYNVLFDRAMKTLGFVRFGRKRFDPTAPKLIPQHKLEIWPGYVTAVDEYEDGVMLCLDVSHRVLCTSTVLELLRNVYNADKSNFQTNALNALLGCVVLTRYNNRFYRIDDIKFDSNPMDTFHTNGRDITYIEYYKSHYNIDIKDLKQPMIIHTEERRIIGKAEKETVTFCLVPEICHLTGITDDMRNDFKVMRDIAQFTRVSPNQRLNSYTQFCDSLNEVPAAKEIFQNWGLSLDARPLQIKGRTFPEEEIIFARKKVSAGPKADFNKYVTNNEVLEAINLTNWLVIHTKSDSRYAGFFIDGMIRNSRPMGITVIKPQVYVLDSDKTELYVQTLRKLINSELQIVVVMCPTSRDDRYAAIKKVCCAELPIPSQVINSRTLSKEDKNRSIIQKIALQMNCKMGGSLWSIKIPIPNMMVCGIDTYHDAGNKANSVSAFVASLNGSYTRWYSRAVIQKQKEELINGLIASFVAALKAYQSQNNDLPLKIIIFRDGVGDGQLQMCKEYEIPQMQQACLSVDPNYKPEFTFIVVQKRINTRVFAVAGKELENPNPGVVLDHTVTRRYMFDFFLVPQSVRQGTVSPTHYIVVYDSANFKPDHLQRLTYKLCFMYYNWPGTVRVPACCQYAHKMAFLVGQSIKRPTAEVLADKLFYL